MLLIGITYIRLETTEERYREKRLETARQVTKLLFYPFDVQSPPSNNIKLRKYVSPLKF